MDSKRRLLIKAITLGILSLFTAIIVSLVILFIWSVSIIIGVLSGLLETLFYPFMSAHDVEDEKMIWEDFIALVVAELACDFFNASLGTGLRGD